MQRLSFPPQRGFQLDRLTDRGQKQPDYEVVALDAQQNAGNASYTLLDKRSRSGLLGSVGRVWRNWWSELLGAMLLVLSFGGMIAMLRDFQDKPLPKWPLGFSFNTALSLFGAIIRFPAMYITAEGIGQLKWLWLRRKRPLSDLTAFDDASRGPWGATKLLWTVRWNDAFAFLGALVTIASLGFDPFTQAVVSFYPCTTPDAGSVSLVNHTNSYFAQETGNTLPNWAQLAIDASFGDPTTIKPPVTCSANACSFPDVYHSIGLCSKCVDVTQYVQTTCSTKGCNYTLLSNEFANSSTTTRAGWTVAQSINGNRPGVVNSRYDAGVFSVTRYDYGVREDNFRMDTETFGYAPQYQSSQVDIVSARPLLGCRCLMYFCVRSYAASVQDGKVQETLVSTSAKWSNWTSETPLMGTVDVKCLDSKVRTRLLDRGYISSDDEWMPWNSTFLNGTEAQEGISNSDALAIPINCVYQMQLYNKLLDWAAYEDFTKSVQGTLKASGDNFSIALDVTTSKPLLTTLWNNSTVTIDSLNRAFNNFTTVATNYMRNINSPIPKNISDKRDPSGSLRANLTEILLNPTRGEMQDWNQAVVGQAIKDTTCIHVRWPWLALPAFIFVGTLAILGILVVKTVLDQEHEVWKSSQNPLIWHGLEGPAEKESPMLASKRAMNDRAKEVHVQLRQTRKGWKLVQAD